MVVIGPEIFIMEKRNTPEFKSMLMSRLDPVPAIS